MTEASGGNLEEETRTDESQTIVRLVGELEYATAPRLEEALDQLRERRTPTLVFEMSDLEFIDSTGLHQLVIALERQREAGGVLVLRSPRPHVMRAIEIAGLSGVFDVS